MVSKELHVGDVGSAINMTVKDGSTLINLDNSVTFRFIKPDGTLVTKTGQITDAASGECRYVTESGFLDQAGDWKLQLQVITDSPSWNGYTEQIIVPVFPVES